MGQTVRGNQATAMMQGAVRGDVQMTMLGSLDHDKTQIYGASKALAEHSKTLTNLTGYQR